MAAKRSGGAGYYTCASPSRMSRVDGTHYLVPCGHCPPCVSRRRDEWAGRILCEMRERDSLGNLRWPYRYFITLTYADGQFPWQPARTDMRDADGSLVDDLKRVEIQRFLKRLRFSNRCRKTKRHATIRYFAVGEHGDLTGRFHWHLVVWSDMPLNGWSIGSRTHANCREHPSEWKFGRVDVGEVNASSIRYAANYVLKNSGACGRGEYIVSMSNRPGIGRRYLEQVACWAADQTTRNGQLDRLANGLKIGGVYFPLGDVAWSWFREAFLASGGDEACVHELSDLYKHYQLELHRHGLLASKRQSDVQLYDRDRDMRQTLLSKSSL